MFEWLRKTILTKKIWGYSIKTIVSLLYLFIIIFITMVVKFITITITLKCSFSICLYFLARTQKCLPVLDNLLNKIAYSHISDLTILSSAI
jgi:hypothetical protein